MKTKFIPIDFDYFDFEGRNYVKLIGRTEKGKRVIIHDWGIGNCDIKTPVSHFKTSDPKYSVPKKNAWPPLFNDKFWAEMSERCLSCRICVH